MIMYSTITINVCCVDKPLLKETLHSSYSQTSLHGHLSTVALFLYPWMAFMDMFDSIEEASLQIIKYFHHIHLLKSRHTTGISQQLECSHTSMFEDCLLY